MERLEEMNELFSQPFVEGLEQPKLPKEFSDCVLTYSASEQDGFLTDSVAVYHRCADGELGLYRYSLLMAAAQPTPLIDPKTQKGKMVMAQSSAFGHKGTKLLKDTPVAELRDKLSVAFAKSNADTFYCPRIMPFGEQTGQYFSGFATLWLLPRLYNGQLKEDIPIPGKGLDQAQQSESGIVTVGGIPDSVLKGLD